MLRIYFSNMGGSETLIARPLHALPHLLSLILKDTKMRRMQFVVEVLYIEVSSFSKHSVTSDMLQHTDGVQFEGQRLRVEMSRGKSDGDDRSRRTDDRFFVRYKIEESTRIITIIFDLLFCRFGGSSRGPPAPSLSSRMPQRDLRRSEFRVIISGLPPSASWQDLKDFFRPVCSCTCGYLLYRIDHGSANMRAGG